MTPILRGKQVKIDIRYGDREDGQHATDRAAKRARLIKHGIGVFPGGDIIYTDRERGMSPCEKVMTRIDVEGHIRSEIIGDTVGVALGISQTPHPAIKV